MREFRIRTGKYRVRSSSSPQYLKSRPALSNSKLLDEDIRRLLANQKRSVSRVRADVLWRNAQIRQLEALRPMNRQSAIHHPLPLPWCHLARAERMPCRGDDLADFLVDGCVVFSGVLDAIVAFRDRAVGFLDDGGCTAGREARVGRGELAAEDGHAAPHFALKLVGPDVLLDVEVHSVLRSGQSVDLLVMRWMGDVKETAWCFKVVLMDADKVEPHISAESDKQSGVHLCGVLTFKYPTSKSIVSPRFGPVMWIWPRENLFVQKEMWSAVIDCGQCRRH